MQTGPCVKQGQDGAIFIVRVAPRASQTAMTGVMGEGDEAVVKVAVAAPPVEGKANAELIAYLADILDVPKPRVEVIAGKQSKNKIIRVAGGDAAEIAARLTRILLTTAPESRKLRRL